MQNITGNIYITSQMNDWIQMSLRKLERMLPHAVHKK